MSKDFCHLHVHTEYSILDGINRVDQLAQHVKEQGMSSCAITDHGTLYGLVEFYKEAQKSGIKPLIGVEAYITFDEDGIEDNKHKTKDNHHCIMVAQNEEGLRNLFWLTNNANLHNFYYRPRISVENLKAGRANGIIATSSCLGGIVSKRGQYRKQSANDGTFEDTDGSAVHALDTFRDIFGGRFYAEIQDNPEFWQQGAYNRWLVEKARDMSIPLVITADAHFLTKEDKATHDLVMAKQMGKTLEEYEGDEDGMVYGEGHYIRSPEEMYQAALKYNAEEAFWNTTEFAKQCDAHIALGDTKMPVFDIAEEDDYNEFQSWKEKRNSCETQLAVI